ncbi:MAG: DUF1836 domain-containing protein [Clostridiales Family XIII bacterium]|jgi:hypothetical protein|nr:DUF1836 domain-containing protein [Clostridiales Family XIII bacterium]
MRYEEYIKQIMDDFAEDSLIKPDAFPSMELYADQVAAFFGEQLRVYAADGQAPPDAVFTESGVSNLVKRGVLPRRAGKKYTRDHLIILTMLFYMESVFQINETERVMRPFVDNYASAFDDKIDFHRIYAAIEPLLKRNRARFSHDLQECVVDVKTAIRGEGIEDDDNTELLLLLLSLAARADAARYAARKLLNEYFALPAAGARGKQPKPAPGGRAKSKPAPDEKETQTTAPKNAQTKAQKNT